MAQLSMAVEWGDQELSLRLRSLPGVLAFSPAL